MLSVRPNLLTLGHPGSPQDRRCLGRERLLYRRIRTSDLSGQGHTVYHPDNLERLYMHQSTDNPNGWTFNAALFSASAVKNGLIDEPSIYAFTRYGLQLPPFPKFDDTN